MVIGGGEMRNGEWEENREERMKRGKGGKEKYSQRGAFFVPKGEED